MLSVLLPVAAAFAVVGGVAYWALRKNEVFFVSAGRFLVYVAWPAVAASVLWSLVTVLVKEELSIDSAARAVALVVLSVYLPLGWRQTERVSDGVIVSKKINPKYVVFDSLHLITLAWAAIALQERSLRLFVGLWFVFAVLVVGHVWNAWSVHADGRPRAVPALIGSLPAAFALIRLCRCDVDSWAGLDTLQVLLPPTSLLVALLLWLLIEGIGPWGEPVSRPAVDLPGES